MLRYSFCVKTVFRLEGGINKYYKCQRKTKHHRVALMKGTKKKKDFFTTLTKLKIVAHLHINENYCFKMFRYKYTQSDMNPATTAY